MVNGGILRAGASTQTALGSVANNVLTLPSLSGGPVGPNSALILANTSGAAFDVDGYNVVVGSLSGGGASGGNLILAAEAA